MRGRDVRSVWCLVFACTGCTLSLDLSYDSDAAPSVVDASGSVDVSTALDAACEERELCNGRDDDCDGDTDEGFDDLEELCVTGVGACARTGEIVCTVDGAGTVCGVVAGEPTEEICDSLDNDCDGQTDEEIMGCCRPGDMYECNPSSMGVCLEGTITCDEDGMWGSCQDESGAVVPVPGERQEVCNQLDDDCDGMTDEDVYFEGEGGRLALGESCSVGLGECTASGFVVCDEFGEAICDAPVVEPADEICDGFDNDCDGETDENFSWFNGEVEYALGSPCFAGLGQCLSEGRVRCSDDGASALCGAVALAPSVEICDGQDNDCDGATDELSEAPCDTGGQGRCASTNGRLVCDSDGDIICIDDDPASQPTVEICNYVDDDCDGSTDEDFKDADGEFTLHDHCGACGHVCDLPHATSMCEFGSCVIATCSPDWTDHNGNPADGCECNTADGMMCPSER